MGKEIEGVRDFVKGFKKKSPDDLAIQGMRDEALVEGIDENLRDASRHPGGKNYLKNIPKGSLGDYELWESYGLSLLNDINLLKIPLESVSLSSNPVLGNERTRIIWEKIAKKRERLLEVLKKLELSSISIHEEYGYKGIYAPGSEPEQLFEEYLKEDKKKRTDYWIKRQEIKKWDTE